MQSYKELRSLIEVGVIRWSDGVNTLFEGRQVLDDVTDHILWRKRKYAHEGLTYTIELMSRRDFVARESLLAP